MRKCHGMSRDNVLWYSGTKGGAMTATDILKEIDSLPIEGQKQVSDFVAFLKIRYSVRSKIKNGKRIKLADEPFIGMWQGREDMQDSTTWVRQLRSSEWNNT